MKLKNVLIVVKDIEASKRFYKDLFGLDVVLDQDGNVILTEGLVLQDKQIWESFIQKDVIERGHDTELYFEEKDIDGFLKKLEESSYEIEYINRDLRHSWGQRVIRIYDLDGHIVEIGEPMNE
ncbi:MAG: VOC family protein [Lachnospiraceae bacterium]